MKKGFTVIELLVIITIIAILAAIMLPALNKAIGSARAVCCVNNLRQVGLVALTYSSDFNDWLPSADMRYQGSTFSYGATLFRLGYISGQRKNASEQFIERAFYCSLTKVERIVNDSYTGRTYGLYCFDYDSWSIKQSLPKNIKKILNPSKFILFADTWRSSEAEPGDYRLRHWGDTTGPGLIYFGHLEGANAWTADGHIVKAMPFDLRSRFENAANKTRWDRGVIDDGVIIDLPQ